MRRYVCRCIFSERFFLVILITLFVTCRSSNHEKDEDCNGNKLYAKQLKEIEGQGKLKSKKFVHYCIIRYSDTPNLLTNYLGLFEVFFACQFMPSIQFKVWVHLGLRINPIFHTRKLQRIWGLNLTRKKLWPGPTWVCGKVEVAIV